MNGRTFAIVMYDSIQSTQTGLTKEQKSTFKHRLHSPGLKQKAFTLIHFTLEDDTLSMIICFALKNREYSKYVPLLEEV